MATYAIGDLQGCYDPLMKLLDKINFNPSDDKLWFAGDLVNRGPDSVKVLRFIKNLKKSAVCVLGNHDLHLLALSCGNLKHQNDNGLQQVLEAKDHDELIHWLRHQPLMYYSKKKNFAMFHAGLQPQWTLQDALNYAQEVEAVLKDDQACYNFCQEMYGNEPQQWSNDLRGMDRLRCITNTFTRLRYMNQRGQMNMKENGALGSQSHGLFGWFDQPRKTAKNRLVFGHWSTLGYYQKDNIWAIDSGCLWGGQLTALRIRKKKDIKAIQYQC